MHLSAPIRRTLAAVAFLVLVLVLAACSSGSTGSATTPLATTPPAAASPTTPPAAASPTTPASPAGGAAGSVTIKGSAFGPGTITVAAGTTVTWTNQDSVPHTATADDGSFDSKTLGNGATFSQTFSTAGTYQYHCAIHSRMTATVMVQ